MIVVQIAADISDLAELFDEDTVIFRTVHLYEEDRASFPEELLGALKYGKFCAFDVALEKVWSGM